MMSLQLTKIKSLIAAAHSLDLASLSEVDVATHISPIMQGYGLKTVSLHANAVLRGRKHLNPDPLAEVRDVWSLSAKRVMSRGRFNHIGESVFYAGDSVEGAFFEVKPVPGDTVTVLVAGVRKKDP